MSGHHLRVIMFSPPDFKLLFKVLFDVSFGAGGTVYVVIKAGCNAPKWSFQYARLSYFENRIQTNSEMTVNGQGFERTFGFKIV
jgi:hypothetical protein